MNLISVKIKKLDTRVSANSSQYLIFLSLSIVIIGLTAILDYENSSIFQRFFASLNPLVIIILTSFSGFLLFVLFLSKNWFAIFKKENLRWLNKLSLLTLPFVAISIIIDLIFVFPVNINILFPYSLLFYPVMGFLAEILFHIIPLAFLVTISNFVFKNISTRKLIWVCLIIAALCEPTYQAVFMQSSPTLVIVLVWSNIYLFNLMQLYIFKHYDFISMYIFRLIYYSMWHIIWGYFRLDLLFREIG